MENSLHIIEDIEQIKKFMIAGKSIFTIKNEKTQNRFTYKIEKAKRRQDLYWVYLLCMKDNDDKSSYKYIGGFSEKEMFKQSVSRSTIKKHTVGIQGIEWLVNKLWNGESINPITFYHSGFCGRCGKRLTVPESIISGFGPECIRTEITYGNNQPIQKLEQNQKRIQKQLEFDFVSDLKPIPKDRKTSKTFHKIIQAPICKKWKKS